MTQDFTNFPANTNQLLVKYCVLRQELLGLNDGNAQVDGILRSIKAATRKIPAKSQRLLDVHRVDYGYILSEISKLREGT